MTIAPRSLKQFIRANASLICVSLALTTLLVDFATGKEIRFPLVYVLPISLAAWMNRKSLAYSMAILLPVVRVSFEFLWQSPEHSRVEVANAAIEVAAMLLFVQLMGRQGAQSRQMEVSLTTKEEEMQHLRAFTRLVGTTLKGRGISSGLADGVAVIHLPENEATLGNPNIKREDAESEANRFDQAVAASIRDLHKIRDQFERDGGHDECALLDVHLTLLGDPSFSRKCKRRVTEELLRAEHAVDAEIHDMVTRLQELKQEFMRQRAADVRDIGHQVLGNLKRSGTAVPHRLACLPPGSIVVAEDLLLSDALQMDHVNVVGIVTEKTGPASHVAILARVRRIPAICDIQDAATLLASGDRLLVDADMGTVTVAPTLSQSARFAHKGKSATARSPATKDPVTGCVTKDGVEIRLHGNIGRPDEARMVMEHGLEGIGLFRSEFLFLDADLAPDLESQAAAYTEVAALFHPMPVVIRTMDLGGDKIPRFIRMTNDPAMRAGMRGLAYSLAEKKLFRIQILAILRAARRGNVKLMFPMVMGVADMTAARSLVDELIQTEPGIRPLIGAMIETPAAVFDLPGILALSDFACVGTNDLAHSILAMDRGTQGHSAVQSLLHPSVLKAMDQIVQTTRKQGVALSVCGEAAGDPMVACLLVGMGVRELSMNPFLVDGVRHAIRQLTVADWQRVASEVLAAPTSEDVQNLLTSQFANIDATTEKSIDPD
ncbi:MAG: phosphoenolpyruvate--protein phosphotransferase [Luteolibacter sp.]|uniref:phosphoenolpyruvate--protein phosphotransferase n=1 Tax=Luteolibacter sp. TaxID=1962973 RepID=UPI0032639FCB